jgi:hypothetical protein
VQAAAPALAENVPAKQSPQPLPAAGGAVRPVAPELPGAQMLPPAQAEAPVALLQVPEGQTVQTACSLLVAPGVP